MDRLAPFGDQVKGGLQEHWQGNLEAFLHQGQCGHRLGSLVRTAIAIIEHLDAEAALVWILTRDGQINCARFLVNRLALNLQFSEPLFCVHSLIIMRVGNPATVESTLFSGLLTVIWHWRLIGFGRGYLNWTI